MSKNDSHHAHMVFDSELWDDAKKHAKSEGFRSMAAYFVSCHNRNVERKIQREERFFISAQKAD